MTTKMRPIRETISLDEARARIETAVLPIDRTERVPLGEPSDYKPCVAQLPDGELLLTAFHQHKQEDLERKRDHDRR